MGLSVQPAWCLDLPLQQQSVLLLAARGPDGVGKHHPSKRVHVAYRATVLVSAKYGRCLEWGEQADTFMSLHELADDVLWRAAVDGFFVAHDELPHHYLMHLAHGAQIVGYKHPDRRFQERWLRFYVEVVDTLHMRMESCAGMDLRLGDWGRTHWAPGAEAPAAPAAPGNSRDFDDGAVCGMKEAIRAAETVVGFKGENAVSQAILAQLRFQLEMSEKVRDQAPVGVPPPSEEPSP